MAMIFGSDVNQFDATWLKFCSPIHHGLDKTIIKLLADWARQDGVEVL